jgi:hypothetical protein
MQILRVIVILGCAIAISGFQSIGGPSFFNGSNEEVDVFIESPGVETVHLLTRFPPHTAFAESEERNITSVTVVTKARRLKSNAQLIAQQRVSMRPKEQLWVFDGEQICVIRNRAIEREVRFKCPAR